MQRMALLSDHVCNYERNDHLLTESLRSQPISSFRDYSLRAIGKRTDCYPAVNINYSSFHPLHGSIRGLIRNLSPWFDRRAIPRSIVHSSSVARFLILIIEKNSANHFVAALKDFVRDFRPEESTSNFSAVTAINQFIDR